MDVRVVTDDLLLVFIEEIVEYFLVQQGDAFEVVARAWLKADNLVDQAVRLVRQVCDVLLPLHFLLDVGRIVADLKLDGVFRERISNIDRTENLLSDGWSTY